ncbi:MAG: alternative ribosome rescue aminoacyl-tRNA hydrolase ArfB [Phycisphaerales bacterium]
MTENLHTLPQDDGPEPGGSVAVAPGVRVDSAALRFAFSRSSGPGGQNVNKRSTKAELRVRPWALPLSESVLRRLLEGVQGFMTDDGDLLIVCDEHRSQGQNKDGCLERLRAMIVRAQAVPKRRIKTRPTRGSKERRIADKKARGETKRDRRGED